MTEDALTRLQRTNAQLRAERDRLRSELAAHVEDLRHERELSRELGERLAAEQARAGPRERALASERTARAQLAQALVAEQAANRRWGALVSEHERRAAAERRFVAAQAQRIAASGAWRWGHRFALLKTRLTFRSTRGTDAVTRLLEHARVR